MIPLSRSLDISSFFSFLFVELGTSSLIDYDFI